MNANLEKKVESEVEKEYYLSVRQVPKDLYKKLKDNAFDNNETMRQAVIRILNEYLGG